VLEFHVPTPEEFRVRQAWLADPEMMAYNADWDVSYPGYDRATGCIDWPESQWPAFEARLRLPAGRQGYFYVLDTETGAFVGHAHYRVDMDGAARIGLNVVPSRRGSGLGVRVLEFLVERIWRDTDATEIVNEFEDDRHSAIRSHRRCGFVPDRGTTTGHGRAVRTWRLRRPSEPQLES
jgi:GNAT superfamily N-acetyltransferase